jgi:enoyl-CoA hydratase/carnithine racemase
MVVAHGSEGILTVTRHSHVRLVEIKGPDAKNSLNGPMHEALAGIWPQFNDDEDVRSVVLTGNGTNFCAGIDLEWLRGVLADPFTRHRATLRDRDIMAAIRTCRVPVIAALQGGAIGLACSIAVHCDFVIMSEDAYLSDPHVRAGLAAGDGGAAMLPVLIPFMRAKQFLLTGEPIPANVAVELGLAIETVPAEELLDRAMAFAQRIAAQPPTAVQLTKRALNAHLGLSVVATELASVAELAGLPEFAANFDPSRFDEVRH